MKTKNDVGASRLSVGLGVMLMNDLIVLAYQNLVEIRYASTRAALLAKCAMELVQLPELCAEAPSNIDSGRALDAQEPVKALEQQHVSAEVTETAEFQGLSDGQR